MELWMPLPHVMKLASSPDNTKLPTCWSFSFRFRAWIINPLKVELSLVLSSSSSNWPGTTQFLLMTRSAGDSPDWGLWEWPGVMAWQAESGAPMENGETWSKLVVTSKNVHKE